MAKGERCAVDLAFADRAALIEALRDVGVEAFIIRRPVVRARAIRERLHLSQSEFALRFGLEMRTVQNWEQERNQLDPAAAILLAVIRDNPGVVDGVLRSDEV